MGNGSGSALELATDAAQLAYKAGGLGDGKVSLGNLSHGLLKLGLDVAAAVLTKEAVIIGVLLEIGIEINIVVYHFNFLRIIFISVNYFLINRLSHAIVLSSAYKFLQKRKRPGQNTSLSRTN
jgi:hypothetical protein